jgi:hypothetical protein
MKRLMLSLAAAGYLVAPMSVNSLSAQQTDPQPTCRMCEGTYLPATEIQEYIKKALAEKRTDQQARDVNIGKAHIGIGVVGAHEAVCELIKSYRPGTCRSGTACWLIFIGPSFESYSASRSFAPCSTRLRDRRNGRAPRASVNCRALAPPVARTETNKPAPRPLAIPLRTSESWRPSVAG